MTGYELDKNEFDIILSGLLLFSIEVENPAAVIGILNKLLPEPTRPWEDVVEEKRIKWRKEPI